MRDRYMILLMAVIVISVGYLCYDVGWHDGQADFIIQYVKDGKVDLVHNVDHR